MSFGRGAVVWLGLAVTLVGAACGSGTCNQDLACYAGGIVDTSSLTAPIASLSADSPCSVTNDGEVLVKVNGTYGNATSGSCQIHATLTDGSNWVAVQSWAPDNSVCCHGTNHNVGPNPKFTRVNGDGGT